MWGAPRRRCRRGGVNANWTPPAKRAAITQSTDVRSRYNHLLSCTKYEVVERDPHSPSFTPSQTDVKLTHANTQSTELTCPAQLDPSASRSPFLYYDLHPATVRKVRDLVISRNRVVHPVFHPQLHPHDSTGYTLVLSLKLDKLASRPITAGLPGLDSALVLPPDLAIFACGRYYQLSDMISLGIVSWRFAAAVTSPSETPGARGGFFGQNRHICEGCNIGPMDPIEAPIQRATGWSGELNKSQADERGSASAYLLSRALFSGRGLYRFSKQYESPRLCVRRCQRKTQAARCFEVPHRTRQPTFVFDLILTAPEGAEAASSCFCALRKAILNTFAPTKSPVSKFASLKTQRTYFQSL